MYPNRAEKAKSGYNLVKSVRTHLRTTPFVQCRHPPFLSRYFCKRMPSSWLQVVDTSPVCITIRLAFVSRYSCQRNSRRLWRSQRRKSRSVPEGGADFPAAIFLFGKCPNLGRDSTWRCRTIGEYFSSSVELCRKTLPARNFGQPQPSRVF